MNKLTKLLSVFIIAGAIGASAAGVAGCSGGNSGNGGGGGGGTCQHTHLSYDDNQDGATHTVTCEDCSQTVNASDSHHDTDHDNYCDECNALMADPGKVASVTVTSGTTVKLGKTLELTAEVLPATATDKTVTWTIESGSDKAEIQNGNILHLKNAAAAGDEIQVKATAGTGADAKSGMSTITVLAQSRFDILSESPDKVIAEDFNGTFEGGKLPDYAGYETTQAGLYGWGDGKDYEAAGCYVKVESKKATQVTAEGKNTSIVADLGENVTGDKVIEGCVELSLSALGSNWAVMALMGKSATVSNTGEVFSILGVDSTAKTIGYRLNRGDAVAVPATDFVFATNTVYEIEYKLDLVSGLIDVSIKVQGSKSEAFKLCDGVQTDITEVATVAFVSSNKGARFSTIDNFAVAVSTLDLAGVKGSLAAKVNAYVEKATTAPDDGANTLTLSGAGVNAAKDSVLEAIAGAADVATAKTAASYSTIDSAILEQAKTSATTLLSNYRSDESFDGEADGTDNGEEWTAAQTKGANAISNATSIDGVREALGDAIEECALVLNDTDNAAPKANITFKEVKSGTVQSGNAGELRKAIGGRELSLEKLLENVTADTFLKIVKIYSDEACTQEITAATGYTPVVGEGATSDAEINLYVVLTDIDNTGTFTFTMGGIKNNADNPLAPAYETSGTEDIDAKDLLVSNTSTNPDSNDFKLGGNGQSLVFNIDVKAGQTITITLTGRSASSGGSTATHVTCTATGAGVSTTGIDKEFQGSTAAPVDAITYTATSNGTVAFTIARKDGTTKLTSIVIEVADAATA